MLATAMLFAPVQAPRTPDPVFRSDVRLVKVLTTVRNPQGQLIGALNREDFSIFDNGLRSAAQRVEHYEMAGYGSVRTYAQMLGFNDAAQALQETLDEEGDTDHKLTQLAVSMVNPEAESDEEEDMSDEEEDMYMDEEEDDL